MRAGVVGSSLAGMVTARTLKYLAALTAVLFAVGAVIGDDRDVLWIVDDIVWFGFLLCAVLLIVLSAGVLARSLKASKRAEG
jgi:hypothetical protein